jgi:hypothetical protein
MNIIRKVLLMAIALGFAFVITSCNDPHPKTMLVEYQIKDKQDRHHNRW